MDETLRDRVNDERNDDRARNQAETYDPIGNPSKRVFHFGKDIPHQPACSRIAGR
ncbi:hypothetical protein [Bradyrhizobium embrapense]